MIWNEYWDWEYREYQKKATQESFKSDLVFLKTSYLALLECVKHYDKVLEELEDKKSSFLKSGYYEDGFFSIKERKWCWEELLSPVHQIFVDGAKRRREYYKKLADKSRNAITPIKSTLSADDAKLIPIENVCTYYNIEINRGFIKSPYHSERTPSCKIYFNTNSFYDFSEGKGGSVIDLVMAIEECSLPDAVSKLQSIKT